VEGSGLAKGNLQQQNASRTPSREDALSALDRCRRSSSSDYYLYGARGIQFLFDSFEQFYAELGPRPSPKHSLDRVNNDGHYEPGNVRWATAKEQASNKRKPDVKDGKNPNARVNDHTVWWIRGLYAVGRYSQAAIAELAGISPSCVSKIVLNKRRNKWSY